MINGSISTRNADMPFPSWFALLVIILTLAGVAVGSYPRLRMNRATIALVGATLLIVIGAVTLEQAYASIDMNTLVLLFSMMVINANLHISGFFQVVASRVVRWARTPRQLLALTVAVSGVLSALFLNDTVVLMFTPILLTITSSMKRRPVPYLIGLVTAANIGSTATIVGNPQNMLIGVSSRIPFTTFTASLAPVALVGLCLVWLVIVLVYRADFRTEILPVKLEYTVRPYRPLLRKSILATALMLAAFIGGVPVPLAALGAASLLLVTRRLKPERVFRDIDWSLLVFFSGLFVVTGAIEESDLSHRILEIIKPLIRHGLISLAAVSAILSNLISNVPAVMLFRPLIPGLMNTQSAWMTLAMATTLAGNLTLLGSVANLIVAEIAKAGGVHLSFKEYIKAGVPITILSLAWGVTWMLMIS